LICVRVDVCETEGTWRVRDEESILGVWS
jgi:hypothetical protein